MTMNMCILMNMNIYISKDNEAYLRTKDSMSGFINKLIDRERDLESGPRLADGTKGFVIPFTKAKKIQEVRSATAEDKVYIVNGSDPVSRTDAIGLSKTPAKANIVMCKVHGIPLDSRGRCLQKGCKYA